MRKLLIFSQLFAWLALISLCVWAWGRSPAIADQPDWAALGISRTGSIVYRTDGRLQMKLELYKPAQGAGAAGSLQLRPGVLVVHGGSWIGGSMTTFRHDAQTLAARLAQRGLVVAAIDYRLARPGSPSWPAVVDDLREAVRWLRRHSAEYRIDPDRIAVIGQSSGGHLAEMLATQSEARSPDGVSSRVQAVVSFYAPADLVDLMRSRHLAHEPARALLGDQAPGLGERAIQASPIEHVRADTPPMLLIHGDDDAWVPIDQSVRMAQRLDRVRVFNRLIVIPGARHGFETAIETPVKRDLLPEMVDFLEQAWKLPID